MFGQVATIGPALFDGLVAGDLAVLLGLCILTRKAGRDILERQVDLIFADTLR